MYIEYLQEKHIHKSLTRKNLYWEPKEEELIGTAKKAQNLTSYQRLSPESIESIEQHNQGNRTCFVTTFKT